MIPWERHLPTSLFSKTKRTGQGDDTVMGQGGNESGESK